VGVAGFPVRQLPWACMSRQFGRASAPTIPQAVQIIRGPKERTSTVSGQRPADSTAPWCHSSRVIASEPDAGKHMFPSAGGSHAAA